MTFHRTSHLVLLILAVVALSAGCSGGGSKAVSSQSIAALKENLLTSADIARTPTGSPERSFLQFWSYCQYRAWSAALAQYEPALVASVRVTNIVEALKTQTSYFQTVRPSLKGVVRAGDEALVRYEIPDAAGHLFATSMSWRRAGNAWRIRYDPQLDGMLQTAEASRVQAAIDPNAPQPAKQALRAGADAARLQSDYLQSTYGTTTKP
jgi:hypothetical protein